MNYDPNHPSQLRACYLGTIDREQAQKKIGNAYRVTELRPAKCLDKESNDLVDATEVLFEPA